MVPEFLLGPSDFSLHFDCPRNLSPGTPYLLINPRVKFSLNLNIFMSSCLLSYHIAQMKLDQPCTGFTPPPFRNWTWSQCVNCLPSLCHFGFEVFWTGNLRYRKTKASVFIFKINTKHCRLQQQLKTRFIMWMNFELRNITTLHTLTCNIREESSITKNRWENAYRRIYSPHIRRRVQ